jgi:translation initiation factor IF-3
MDFGKYKYEEAQRAKESRRKSTNISIKEMKYRPKIGVGDFETKTRKVSEFLSEGHKVKITIMFRGREVFHPELGAKILDSIAEHVAPVGKVETHARLDGRNMTMVLAPDKRAQAAAKREPREPSDTEPGDTPPDVTPAPDAPPDATAPAPDAAPAASAPAPDAAPVVSATASAPPEPQG